MMLTHDAGPNLTPTMWRINQLPQNLSLEAKVSLTEIMRQMSVCLDNSDLRITLPENSRVALLVVARLQELGWQLTKINYGHHTALIHMPPYRGIGE